MTPSPVLRARSWLFVPGNRQDRFAKAYASGTDQVILDLEDAVAPADKGPARSAITAWLRPDRAALVRINARDTEWYARDCELASHPGVRGLMISKAESLEPGLVAACTRNGKVLVPLVETAVGFENLAALATTASVERLAFGSIDFQVDLGIEGDDALAYFRSQLVLASRLADIRPPLDGVTTDINNPKLLRHETLLGKRFGFAGKLCIHPGQVAAVNELMAPSDAQLSWARRILEATARSDSAVVVIDGKMVDKPVVAKAARIMQAAGGSAPCNDGENHYERKEGRTS